jgi:hypothetical protein
MTAKADVKKLVPEAAARQTYLAEVDHEYRHRGQVIAVKKGETVSHVMDGTPGGAIYVDDELRSV